MIKLKKLLREGLDATNEADADKIANIIYNAEDAWDDERAVIDLFKNGNIHNRVGFMKVDRKLKSLSDYGLGEFLRGGSTYVTDFLTPTQLLEIAYHILKHANENDWGFMITPILTKEIALKALEQYYWPQGQSIIPAAERGPGTSTILKQLKQDIDKGIHKNKWQVYTFKALFTHYTLYGPSVGDYLLNASYDNPHDFDKNLENDFQSVRDHKGLQGTMELFGFLPGLSIGLRVAIEAGLVAADAKMYYDENKKQEALYTTLFGLLMASTPLMAKIPILKKVNLRTMLEIAKKLANKIPLDPWSQQIANGIMQNRTAIKTQFQAFINFVSSLQTNTNALRVWTSMPKNQKRKIAKQLIDGAVDAKSVIDTLTVKTVQASNSAAIPNKK